MFGHDYVHIKATNWESADNSDICLYVYTYNSYYLLNEVI